MREIIYPTLDLFIYQLRNGLGDSDTQIAENHQSFWKNLPDKIKVSLEKESEAENPEYAKLLELLESSIKQAHNIKDNYYLFSNEKNLESYYYPVRLYDTYGLLFDTSINDRKNSQPITSFNTLAKQAETKKGNLGKSWMASGYLSTATKPDPKALAEHIYRELVNREWQNPQEGKFLGANLFEVWKSPQKWQDIESENSHTLIVIYPNLWTMQLAADFYGDWLRLLCSRNKILWEYAYSQQLTKELQDEFKLIINRTQKIKNLYASSKNTEFNQQQLNKLQKILSNSIATVSDYATKLSYLEILKSAIETNLLAYKKYLKDIEIKAQEKQKEDNQIGDTNIQCLEKFTETVQQKYKIQVEQDYISLSVGLKIAEDLINTVRGIIDIEQTKRDRTLNTTVAVAGIGLATSQIASAVILAQQPNDYQNYLRFRAEVFGWSLLIGSIFAVVMYLILRLFRHK